MSLHSPSGRGRDFVMEIILSKFKFVLIVYF